RGRADRVREAPTRSSTHACGPRRHRRRRRGDCRFRPRRGGAPPARGRAPLPANQPRLTRCRVKTVFAAAAAALLAGCASAAPPTGVLEDAPRRLVVSPDARTDSYYFYS